VKDSNLQCPRSKGGVFTDFTNGAASGPSWIRTRNLPLIKQVLLPIALTAPRRAAVVVFGEWSGRLDSNQRPPGSRPGALTRLSYAQPGLVEVRGEASNGLYEFLQIPYPTRPDCKAFLNPVSIGKEVPGITGRRAGRMRNEGRRIQHIRGRS
jgi:hypothetical protein